MRERNRSLRERLVRIAARDRAAIDLAEPALLIAAEEYEDLDVTSYLARLDTLAAGATRRLAGCRSDAARATAFNRYLFVEEGFAGNRGDYYDPRNSYLNEVLDRRSGIPITLCLVYMAVARRVGCDVRGVGFPGHFLVKWVGAQELIVDPFSAAVLSREDCQDRLTAVLGNGAVLDPATHLRAAAPLEILVRLLGNLKQIFTTTRDWPRALACCDRILLLAPHAPIELRDRAAVHEQLGWTAAALADLETLLELVPEGEAAIALRTHCAALRARLH